MVENEKPSFFEDSNASPIPPIKIEDSSQEEKLEFNIDDLLQEPSDTIGDSPQITRPFRSFSAVDFGLEPNLVEDLQKEAQEAKTGLSINRNIFILILVLVLGISYYAYTQINKRTLKAVVGKHKRKKQIKKIPSTIKDLDSESLPLWDITDQRSLDSAGEQALLEKIREESGRPNPFAVPDSIIADLQVVIKRTEEKKQEPKFLRRRAYRATLVGVLTSDDKTVALFNFQEASFDVMKGLGKDKILKEAIKSMDKARISALELGLNAYLGPWRIIQITAPKGLSSEAKIVLQLGTEHRVLTLGKAEELGIFDENGHFDNLDDYAAQSDVKFPF